MDDERPTEIIRQSIKNRTDAGSIGGVNAYFDDDKRPTVMLSVIPKEAPSARIELHEGDTFELGPELWQVTEIVGPNTDRWVAVLIQLR